VDYPVRTLAVPTALTGLFFLAVVLLAARWN
jgi:hypothetical protein